VTVNVLEAFMEAILLRSFQLFRRILKENSYSTKTPSLLCWIRIREQLKISWSQVRKVWGILRCCHIVLLRNPWPKLTVAMENCREGETNCWFSIFLIVSLSASVRQRRTSIYISLLAATLV